MQEFIEKQQQLFFKIKIIIVHDLLQAFGFGQSTTPSALNRKILDKLHRMTQIGEVLHWSEETVVRWGWGPSPSNYFGSCFCIQILSPIMTQQYSKLKICNFVIRHLKKSINFHNNHETKSKTQKIYKKIIILTQRTNLYPQPYNFSFFSKFLKMFFFQKSFS